MDRAWARTLADSILKDFCYKGVVRNDLLAYIRNDLGGDPNNFWNPALDREDLLRRHGSHDALRQTGGDLHGGQVGEGSVKGGQLL